jgi:hypothetical protein
VYADSVRPRRRRRNARNKNSSPDSHKDDSGDGSREWPDEYTSPDEICPQQRRELASPDVEP